MRINSFACLTTLEDTKWVTKDRESFLSFFKDQKKEKKIEFYLWFNKSEVLKIVGLVHKLLDFACLKYKQKWAALSLWPIA